ncbi:MAG: chromate transporter, partial [Oceanospirillaceae bacterium]|nr:chromate transporter [Oceanospirillaceae bacterium]
AISAAVVGVILNLALFFAWHVLWPQGWQGDFMFAQALLGSAAFIALFKFEQSIVRVIMASAVIGALFL